MEMPGKDEVVQGTGCQVQDTRYRLQVARCRFQVSETDILQMKCSKMLKSNFPTKVRTGIPKICGNLEVS
jgi:hypothetical protein